MMTSGLDLTHLQNEKSSMCGQNQGPTKVKQTKVNKEINVESHQRMRYFWHVTVITLFSL